jgi:hypothetical protein
MAHFDKNRGMAKKHFRETQPDKEKKTQRDISASKMVTRKEICALEARLKKPEPKQEMNPNDPDFHKQDASNYHQLKNIISQKKKQLYSSDMKKRFNRSR